MSAAIGSDRNNSVGKPFGVSRSVFGNDSVFLRVRSENRLTRVRCQIHLAAFSALAVKNNMVLTAARLLTVYSAYCAATTIHRAAIRRPITLILPHFIPTAVARG